MGDNISSGIKNALSLQKKGYRMSYEILKNPQEIWHRPIFIIMNI
ncbi:MAG: hypothetical protein AB8V23_02585 [Candidatus Midichloria sp.]